MLHGIEIYEILDSGNILNGIYTNTGSRTPNDYQIDNEIARKDIQDLSYNNGRIDGTYLHNRYIALSDPQIVTHCILTVTRHGEAFDFEWVDLNKATNTLWKGIGLMVGNNHVAVSYSKP